MALSHINKEALLALALERPVASRHHSSTRCVRTRMALRRRLEGLLAAHEDSVATPSAIADLTRFQPEHPEPPGGRTLAADFVDAPDEAVGHMLGRYKLLEKVGEGGCGVVYVAEQTEPVRRRVALKVIKLGMDTKRSSPGSRQSGRRWR